MPGILEGFNTGFGAGSNIRKRWESDSARAAAREFQERQFQAMEKHRRFSEDLQQQQLALQQKAQDNVLMTQVHGLLSNPQLHPQAKAFMLDDIARQRGHDPKSEYYQGIKKVIITMPADQARALSSGLIAAYPKMQPGQIGKTVDGLLNGQIPATQIPGLIKELNAARQVDEQAATESGMFKHLDAGGATGQPGMPLDNFGQGGDAAPEQNGQKGALPAPAPVQNGQTGATSGYGGPEGGPGTVQTGASMDLPTDFTGQKGALGEAPTGTLEFPGGTGGDQFLGEVGPMSAGTSPAQPGMAGQLDQMRGVMSEQGGTPPGTPPQGPETLGQMLGYHPKPAAQAKVANRAVSAPMGGNVPTDQPSMMPGEPLAGDVAPAYRYAELAVRFRDAGDIETAERYEKRARDAKPLRPDSNVQPAATPAVQAPTPLPHETPKYWMDAAAMVEKSGVAGAKEKAKGYRDHAKQLGELQKQSAEAKEVKGAEVDAEQKAVSTIGSMDQTIRVIADLATQPGLEIVVGNPASTEIDVPLGGSFNTISAGGKVNVLLGSILKQAGYPEAGERFQRGGRDVQDFYAAHGNLRGKMIVELIRDMKGQSQTGATGFGQLNQKELEVIENAAAKLSLNQRPETYRNELNTILSKLLMMRDQMTSGYRQKVGRDLPVGSTQPLKEFIQKNRNITWPDLAREIGRL